MLRNNLYGTNELVPVMLQLVRLLPNVEKTFNYDNNFDLNMINIQGEYLPAVLMPECVAWLKTKQASGGED